MEIGGEIFEKLQTEKGNLQLPSKEYATRCHFNLENWEKWQNFSTCTSLVEIMFIVQKHRDWSQKVCFLLQKNV